MLPAPQTETTTLAPGEGALAFRAHGATTDTETCIARSPLKLLTPKNHGSFAWVFAANFGGGLVCGDTLKIHARVHPHAAAMLGTQSATKVYRSGSEAGGRQELEAHVEDHGSLVVLPDPVCCFEGARYTQSNVVHLGTGASLVLLDGFTCGRSARGERWDFARYFARTRIVRKNRLIFLDATLLDPAHGDLGARMGRFEAMATLIAIGPRFASIVRALLALPGPLTRRADVILAASPIGDDAAVLRVAGTTVEKVTLAVRSALGNLPETLGDDPFARKW